MNNELLIINNNELEATKEGIKLIKQVQKAKVQFQIMEEKLKELFLTTMEENNIKKYISPDGTFKVTYYEETTQNRIDSKKLKEEQPDIYNKYLKTSNKKAYVKFN